LPPLFALSLQPTVRDGVIAGITSAMFDKTEPFCVYNRRWVSRVAHFPVTTSGPWFGPASSTHEVLALCMTYLKVTAPPATPILSDAGTPVVGPPGSITNATGCPKCALVDNLEAPTPIQGGVGLTP
jgi:hypothetical protein